LAFVKAFVQTSSVAVVRYDRHDELLVSEEGATLVDLTDFPKSAPNAEGHTYVDTMAAADELVLSCNNPPSLATCCLRLPAVYGPNDSNITRPLIDYELRTEFLRKDKEFDPLYVANAVQAHILAAKALLSCHTQTGPKVDGQAFFITDGNPMAFKQFAKEFQTAVTAIKSGTIKEGAEAREKKDTEEDLAQLKQGSKLRDRISTAVDKVLQTNEEEVMSRFIVDWVDHSRTYSVDKAKERLKYEPIVETTQRVKSAVEWAMGPERKAEEKLEEEAKKWKRKDRKKEKKANKMGAKRRENLYNSKTVRGTAMLTTEQKSDSESDAEAEVEAETGSEAEPDPPQESRRWTLFSPRGQLN
jgi:nucleoside-diphosphate-sugar epimerase